MTGKKEQLRDIFDGLQGKNALKVIYQREFAAVMEACAKHAPALVLKRRAKREDTGMEYRLKISRKGDSNPFEIHFDCSGTVWTRHGDGSREVVADFCVARHLLGRWIEIANAGNAEFENCLANSKEQPLQDMFYGYAGHASPLRLYDRELKAAVEVLQSLLPEMGVEVFRPGPDRGRLHIKLNLAAEEFCIRLWEDGRIYTGKFFHERNVENFPHLLRQIGAWVQENAPERLKEVKRRISKELMPDFPLQTVVPVRAAARLVLKRPE